MKQNTVNRVVRHESQTWLRTILNLWIAILLIGQSRAAESESPTNKVISGDIKFQVQIKPLTLKNLEI